MSFKEYHRRKERARLERLEERKSQQLRQAFYETDEEQDDFFGDDGHDVDDGQDEVVEDVPEDVIDDLDLLNPHMGGDLGAVAAGELDDDDFNAGGDLDNADSDETLSYEEMVARKVEQFVTKSQEYMRSSELAMKVILTLFCQTYQGLIFLLLIWIKVKEGSFFLPLFNF